MAKKLLNNLIIVILILNISGCSTPSVTPNTASEMDWINYGMKIKEVEFQLDHSGKPLFKFGDFGLEYYITVYRPSRKSQNYLFIYENKKLVSIVTAYNGVKIWQDNFGKYSQSLPKKEMFRAVVESLKDNAISEELSFTGRNSTNSNEHDGAGIELLAVQVGLFIPGVREILLGTSLVAMGGSSSPSNEKIEKLKPIEINSQKYYQQLLGKFDKVKLSENKNSIVSKLGKPNHIYNIKKQTLLVYSGVENTILGLVNNKLEWLAFDYPLSIKGI